jgi:anti-anti-sigma factor
MLDEGDVMIEVEPDLEGRVVVLVRGPLDLPEAGDLRSVFEQLCAHGCPHVVLDLSGVTFIGSSGMGVIAGFRGQLASQRRTLLVRGASPTIRKAFEITHLDRVIPFEPPPESGDDDQSAKASGGGQAQTRLRSP